MEYVSMKCPNCAGDIQYSVGTTECVCPYCDSHIAVHRTVDEQRLAVLEEENRGLDYRAHVAEEMEKKRAEYVKSLKHWDKVNYILMILTFVLSIITFAINDTNSDVMMIFGLPMLLITIFAAPIRASALPKRSQDIQNVRDPGGKAGNTFKLYAMLFGAMLFGVIIGLMITPNKDSDKTEDTSSAVVSQAEETDSAGE
jgi:DNA-directed RNA polymerase subunit RPC12/RpoP